MSTYNLGHIALANNNSNSGYRTMLFDFHGYEGEDFRYFLENLEAYFAINNIHDNRKLTILKTQLKGPAKIHFEKDVFKKMPDLKYDQAIEHLKNHYITPELIQKYELEFSDMQQGEQEHPRIFLSRLQAAAELANIDNEAIIESRFRTGLIREIKLFCIQCSSKTLKDWMTHAEGWWNANRPRKIAMVDNPFIPRNANQALIYHSDTPYYPQQHYNNHNIELVDPNEYTMPAAPFNNVQFNGISSHRNVYPENLAMNQLAMMDIKKNNNYIRGQQDMDISQQQSLIEMIQQTIRHELNNQQNGGQNSRNFNRYNRNQYGNNDYQYNRNNGTRDNYNRYNGRPDYNNDIRNYQRNQNNQPPSQQQPKN